LLDLGISRFKHTKRGKKAGRKYRQKMAASTCTITNGISLYSLNCQGVKYKSTRGIITDLFVEHDIEIFALQETWLADDASHDFYVTGITPPGYDIYNIPRGRGDSHGGVAVVFKKGMKIVFKSDNRDGLIKSFEYCDIVFTSGSKCFTLVNIYRPPPSSKNKLTTGMFFDEFSEFLQDYAISKGELDVVGDLNLHLDVLDDPDTRKFNQLMESLGLIQSVVGPTHIGGHTLDVVISREMDSLVKSARILDRISDHNLIACDLNLRKPPVPKKTITSRKLRSILIQSL
jgi:exonuclease III